MNGNPSPAGFGITADDVRDFDWRSVLEAAQAPECQYYNTVLAKKEAELGAAGDNKGQRVFRFLAVVSSFWPNYDSIEEPYKPMATIEDRRTAIPADLTPSDLDVLAHLLGEIDDAEFRARVADVLWLRRKDYKAAQFAVEAYLESARRLEELENWPPFIERLNRGAQIGAQLGRMKKHHLEVLSVIEAAITRREAGESGLGTARLMHLLTDAGHGDPQKYGTLAVALAERMESIRLWNFACDYWHARRAWALLAKDPGAAQVAQLRVATVYARRAEEMAESTPPSFMGAAHWQAKAVHAFREARADDSMIEASHKRLLEFERCSTEELKPIELPADATTELNAFIRQQAELVAGKLKGRPFEDAIILLAFVAQPVKPAMIRARVERPDAGVFSQLFAVSQLRGDGKVAEIKPPLAASSHEQREDAVRKEMFSQACMIDWPVSCRAIINPAREQIVAEHPASLVDLHFLVVDNPFIPAGREAIFQRGLHAGLHGDMMLALHLLVPQIENSIRTILAAKGVITSKLESDAGQDERDLGWLLAQPEMESTFGPAITFDLRGLLVERFGLNMRNELAHGLMDMGLMYSEGALYLWWLILRLCCVPLAKAKSAARRPVADPPR